MCNFFNYVFGSLQKSKADIHRLESFANGQQRFDKRVALFAIIATVNIGMLTICDNARSNEIRQLREEIGGLKEELKQTKGD